jgi:hypothetical protein
MKSLDIHGREHFSPMKMLKLDDLGKSCLQLMFSYPQQNCWRRSGRRAGLGVARSFPPNRGLPAAPFPGGGFVPAW